MATAPTPVGVGIDTDGSIAAGGVPIATTTDRTDFGVVATATIDGLSHNNSARDQDALPRPLDKTRKTMQLNIISAVTTRNSEFDDSTTSTFQEILGEDNEEGEECNETFCPLVFVIYQTSECCNKQASEQAY